MVFIRRTYLFRMRMYRTPFPNNRDTIFCK